jgi:3-phenylpropionate/trans-cinnamate dioxygenase ferredoxin reductase subunit
MRTRRTLQAIFWIAVYILLAILPLLILIPGPRLPRQGFWQLFAVALGFAGLSMMGLQFVLTARFKTIKAPYGSDVVYHFHREISLAAFALVLAHILILITVSQRARALLNFFTAPTHARAALISTLLLIILVALSIWRKPIRFDYTWWRVSHGILGVIIVILAMVHVLLVGFYINTPAKDVLWSAYTVFWILLLFYVRLFKPLLLLRRPYQVSQVSAERGNSWTLHVKPQGHAGMRFQPGQFAWLTFGRSPFSETEHPFSFSSNAEDSGATTFTIKELGDFTRTVKDIPPGKRIYVDGPFGIMSPDQFPDAKSFVLIAGGIGIAPMMSMLRTAGTRSDMRPYVLFYAIGTWEEATFREEIETLSNTLKLEVVYILSNPPEKWQGESGYITREILERYLPQARDDSCEVFICGPEPLMNSVEQALVQLGVFIGSIHAERFDLV